MSFFKLKTTNELEQMRHLIPGQIKTNDGILPFKSENMFLLN